MWVAPNCGTKVKGFCELALSSHKTGSISRSPPSPLSLSLLRARSLSSLSFYADCTWLWIISTYESFFFSLQRDTNFEIHQRNTHLGILENLKNQRKSNNNPKKQKTKTKKKKKSGEICDTRHFHSDFCCVLDFVYFCFWLEFSLLSCFIIIFFSLLFGWSFLFFSFLFYNNIFLSFFVGVFSSFLY